MPSRPGGVLSEAGHNKFSPLSSSYSKAGSETMPVKQQYAQNDVSLPTASSYGAEKESAAKDGGDKVVVAVRVRPLTSAEQQQSQRSCVSIGEGGEVMLRDDVNASRAFRFDHCFDSSTGGATQEEVFSKLGRDLLSHAWTGYNSSVFAYGQTGSGKTHTMMGNAADGEAGEGLVPRVGRALLRSIEAAREKGRNSEFRNALASGDAGSGDESDDDLMGGCGVRYRLKATYIEIYNEKVYDLMAPSMAASSTSSSSAGAAAPAPPVLRVRENPKTGPFVEGAVSRDVSSWEQMKAFLEQGTRNRRTAATNMNIESSRSHAVFTLEFKQSTARHSMGGTTPSENPVDSSVMERVSRLCLVDLAGSERADKTGATGVRLRESGSINKSLVALGVVINALADHAERLGRGPTAEGNKENRDSPMKGGNASFVPYRDSTLTYLLSDSLGGNAKTVMVATISPSSLQYEETLSTLRYADRAKCIVTHARVNEDPKEAYIRSLEAQLSDLRHQLQGMKLPDPCSSSRLSPPLPVLAEHAHSEEEDEERQAEARRMREDMERQISTLKLQNFARATLLSRASLKLASSSSAPKENDRNDPELSAITSSASSTSSSRPRNLPPPAELPYLLRLSDAPTPEPAFYLSSEETHFDAQGRVVPSSERAEREVAFSLESYDSRLFVTVAPQRRVCVNGVEVFFTKRAEPLSMEVWSGTRLATSGEHAWLLLFDGPSPSPAQWSDATARRHADHVACWDALRAYPSCYARLAQLELRRGVTPSAEEVGGLCRGWVSDDAAAASGDGPRPLSRSGLQSPALAEFSSVASSEGEDLSDSHGSALPPPPGPSRRRPSPTETGVSRLPRLAKHRPLASLSAAPSLTSTLTLEDDEDCHVAPSSLLPPAPPMATRRSIPMQDRTPAGQLVVHDPSKSSRPTTLLNTTSTSRALVPRQGPMFDPTTNVSILRGRALDARARLDKAEASLVSTLRDRLGQDDRLVSLRTEALSAVPLLTEATSLAMATNRRLSFFLDLTPSDPSHHTTDNIRRRLEGLEEGQLAALLGIDGYYTHPSQQSEGEDSTQQSNLPLLPRLLELACADLGVAVRVQNDLDGRVAHFPVSQFRDEVLPALRASRGHMLTSGGVVSPVPLLQFPGVDATIGAAHVYLARLLSGQNVVGEYPLLSEEDGACVGSVTLRLLPEDALPEDGKDGFELRLEIDHLTLDRCELAHLTKPAPQQELLPEELQPRTTACPGLVGGRSPSSDKRLVLRYAFFHPSLGEELELSDRSSRARGLLQRSADEPGDHVTYPIAHRRTLSLPTLDGPFLAYLATGALTLTLAVTRQAEPGAGGAKDAVGPLAHSASLSEGIAPPAYPHADDGVPHCDRYALLFNLCAQRASASLSVDDCASQLSGSGPLPQAPAAGAHSAMPGPHMMMPSGNATRASARLPADADAQSMVDLYTSRRTSAREQSGFFRAHNPRGDGASTFVFVAVDVEEPVLEPGLDPFDAPHRHYKPVDVKRPRPHVNRSAPSSSLPHRGGGLSTLSLAPSSRFHAPMGGHNLHDMDDDMSLDRASEMWSEMDTSLAFTAANGTCAEPVFHLTANHSIRDRRVRIRLEQVDPLHPLRLESVAGVLCSQYCTIDSERDLETQDLATHLACNSALHFSNVRRSPDRRRIELDAYLPYHAVFNECSRRGNRVAVAIQPLLFVEGVVQPVPFTRLLLFKVLPVKRQASLFSSMRRSLRDPTQDRLHTLGTYVAIKPDHVPLLEEALGDYIHYRLHAQTLAVERAQRARQLQEAGSVAANGQGSDAIKPLADAGLDGWKDAINSPMGGGHGSSSSNGFAAGSTDHLHPAAHGSLPPRPSSACTQQSGGYGTQGPSGAHSLRRRPVPAFLDHVALHNNMDDPASRPRVLKQQTLCALFGVTVGPSSSRLASEEEAQVAYPHPKGPMESQREWEQVERVRVEDTPDYPLDCRGFLGLRTGLLGVSWTRMWCVYTRPFLYYYKNKHDRKPLGVISVTDCRVFKGDEDYEMVLRGPKRAWHLQAANDFDFVSWAATLDAMAALVGVEQSPMGPSHGPINHGPTGHSQALVPAGHLASQSVWSDN